MGVDVYTDPQATTLCSDIDWGTLDEGDTATKTIYVKNTGNTTETLTMHTTDWTPATAESLMTLSWDQEATLLQPGEIVTATLTLSTSWDMGDVETFNFNLVIQGLA